MPPNIHTELVQPLSSSEKDLDESGGRARRETKEKPRDRKKIERKSYDKARWLARLEREREEDVTKEN